MKNRISKLAAIGLVRLDQPTDPAGGGGDPTPPAGATPPAPVPTPPATPPAPVPTPPATPAAPAAPAEWDGNVDSLPEGAQKMIKDLRGEAGDRRTKFNDAMKTLAEALGVELPGADEEKLTPEQLAEALRGEREKGTGLEGDLKDTRTRLAIYETASVHKGNPTALADSRSFLAKVANLDHTAEDFSTQVAELAKSAVAENNSLKAVQATGQSAVDHAGGSGEPGDLDAQIAEAEKAGDTRLAIRLKRQKAYAGQA